MAVSFSRSRAANGASLVGPDDARAAPADATSVNSLIWATLRRRLRSGSLGRYGAGVAVEPAPVLVERERELSVLGRVLEEARQGRGGVVACADPVVLGALVTTLVTPVVTAVRVRAAVAERVLWGNVASSVASARRLVAAARPDAAPRAADVARHLLTTAPLAATATLYDPVAPDVGWSFHRRSCCLYYRVPGGGTCGDCVLRRPVHGNRTARNRPPPLA